MLKEQGEANAAFLPENPLFPRPRNCGKMKDRETEIGENQMAITINIYYKGKKGNAKRFAEEMISSGTVNDIRAETGNIRYEYFLPIEDEETVLLIDSWVDQHSLDAHHASPMMEKISNLREKYDLHMKVERYVSEENGISATDTAFIRA